ncbi:hypothetical protein HanIR_Chr06g0266951 [Helianthus annuus]|nr:hypothetical protein HanIR_Chr06g0266951 [Helianthus annuus]
MFVIRRAVREEDRCASSAEQAVDKELGTIFSNVAVSSDALCTHYQRVGVVVHLCSS